MTDDERTDDAAGNAEPSALDRMLADPAVWEEVDPALEDRIVAAIAAEVDAVVDDAPVAPADGDRESSTRSTSTSNVTSISTARRWGGPVAAGIAAALVLLIGFVVVTGDRTSFDHEVAMSGTDLAPGASADLAIEATPNGTRLVLDVTGLPPAPDGQVYEAWMRQDADVGVSAGTFHMRGGDGDLELWSGVLIEDYPLVTVTLQDEADTTSSGRVVLRALIEH